MRNEISVQPPLSFRILLAEDNLVNQKIAIRLLSSQGHSVTIAEDAERRSRPWTRNCIGVVLMDVQVPVIDGFEAVAEIRKREKATGGQDGYIRKAIDNRRLFAILGSLATQPLSSTRYPKNERGRGAAAGDQRESFGVGNIFPNFGISTS